MTDQTFTVPASSDAPRMRGSFWLGLPIAVACILAGHVLAFQVDVIFYGTAGSLWDLAAFVAPFAAWTATCLLRRRWWSFAGSLLFPIALAALWIFAISRDMGC